MKQNPLIVYKYRDWDDSYSKKMLLENELFLASPKAFNDPFDCRINQNFSLLPVEEERRYVDNMLIQAFPRAEAEGIDLRVVIRDIDERMKNKVELQKTADAILYDHQNRCYGIFSCSRRWDSILMWSHYSDKHRGFCVGFWWEKMMYNGLFGKGGDVTYQADFPKIKPCPLRMDDYFIEKSFIETHTKAKEWQYEEEYRFMRTKVEGFTDEERKVYVPNDFFTEVILGIAMSDDHKLEIKNICESKGIKVYHAKKVDFKFEIDREET